jgi:hypothetical protein
VVSLEGRKKVSAMKGLKYLEEFDPYSPESKYPAATTVQEWHGAYAFISAWVVLRGWDRARVMAAKQAISKSTIANKAIDWRYIHLLEAWLNDVQITNPLIPAPPATWAEVIAVQALCDLERAARALFANDHKTMHCALLNALSAALFARSLLNKDQSAQESERLILATVTATKSKIASSNAAKRNAEPREFALSRFSTGKYKSDTAWVDGMEKELPLKYAKAKLPRDLRRSLRRWLEKSRKSQLLSILH